MGNIMEQVRLEKPTPYWRKAAKRDFLHFLEREEVRQEVFARDPPYCVWCQCELGQWYDKHLKEFSVDHIITRADGGIYHADNLVLACIPCNTKRGDRTLIRNLARQNNLKTAKKERTS